MVPFRSVYLILMIDMVLFRAFLPAFSFTLIPMWLGIQQNVMIPFLKIWSIFPKRRMMNRFVVSLFFRAANANLNSENMTNLFGLLLLMISEATTIAAISALYIWNYTRCIRYLRTYWKMYEKQPYLSNNKIYWHKTWYTDVVMLGLHVYLM